MTPDTKDRLSPCSCTRIHPQQCPHGSDTLPPGIYCAAVGLSTKDWPAGEGLQAQQRRVVQIAAAFDAGDGCGGISSSYQPTVCLYALCNDGTLWVQAQGQWIDLPPIPQPDEPHNHAYNTVGIGIDPDREQRIRELVEAARAYRDAETDGTPRMWRGKDLQDLANALDDALTSFAEDRK